MPLFWAGRPRKRWRYVGVYGPDLMFCAAKAEVGLLGQCFWGLWDREGNEARQHTRLRPGGNEVSMQGNRVEVEYRGLKVRLELGEQPALETFCPSGSGWAWTRKCAGVPVTGEVEINGRRRQIEAFGVDDQSAGYHQRRTNWMWSAGVGTDRQGRPLAWNLVTGINDPAQGSERGIWLDGELAPEPAPVRFDDMDGVVFSGGDQLRFTSESERARNDNFLLVKSSYRHRFGTFSGALEGGLELAEGFGVMERHEARW